MVKVVGAAMEDKTGSGVRHDTSAHVGGVIRHEQENKLFPFPRPNYPQRIKVGLPNMAIISGKKWRISDAG